MKHPMKSRLAVLGASLALVAGGLAGAAPASAAPSLTTAATVTTEAMPTLGFGVGARLWWCWVFNVGCQ